MTLAFYAPMKPPGHAVPSGDRAIAQALMAALSFAGAQVTLASRLQTRDGKGDHAAQSSLFSAAEQEVARILATAETASWQAWVTYHNYYKAPDLVGPAVAKSLRIPYVQIESTRARKRLTGPWAPFAKAAEDATDAADIVLYFSNRDAEALRAYAPEGQRHLHLPPFLNRAALPAESTGRGPMLSAGMMRAGDKLASYHIIAETLGLLHDTDWYLDVAGDGPARPEVERLMAPFGHRTRFLGQLDPDGMQAAYTNASLFFWPGVNEALGMVYLEAQAAGLPVVAQDRPGMRDVIAPGVLPDPANGAAPLARCIQDLLNNSKDRQNAGIKARQLIYKHHLLPQAAQTLTNVLASVGVHP